MANVTISELSSSAQSAPRSPARPPRRQHATRYASVNGYCVLVISVRHHPGKATMDAPTNHFAERQHEHHGDEMERISVTTASRPWMLRELMKSAR